MLALIDAFHKELSDIRELSDGTVENYTYSVVDYYDYAKNTIKIDPVFSKGTHLLRWLAHVRKNGLGDSRLKNHQTALKTFFALLVKLNIIKKNPADALPKVNVKRSKKNTPISKKSVYKLLRSIDQSTWHGKRDYLIIAMLWALGLRVNELTSLRVKSFEPDHDPENNIGLLRVIGKGKKQRALFVVDKLYETLINYLDHPETPDKKNAPLFPIKAGTAISNDRVRKSIKERCDAANINNRLSPHVLRHTFATDMYHQGIPLQAIQAMMGHNNKAETSVYVHISDQVQKQALEQITLKGGPLWL
ncbi:MAG: tyrosine-type recombinase/integrase [Desulfobacteraceae bacterium]|nr:tyrosine-type recombinase/integrase [Desulfobacteraceae bacterium]